MLAECRSLLEQADSAMQRGQLARAASLLELAQQRGRDAEILLRLATVRRALGDFHGATTAAMAGVELAPRNFVMALLLGSLREATGASHGAMAAYRAALKYAPERVPFQPGIERQLARARQLVDAEEDWQQRLLDWTPANPSDGREKRQFRRLRDFRANLLEHLDSQSLASPKLVIPGLPARQFFEPDEFEGIGAAAEEWAAMRDEFTALVGSNSQRFAQRMRGLHANVADPQAGGQWSMIPLIRNGRVVPEFADRCPATMAAVAGLDMPRLGTISPSVYFSTLEPGTHIPAHTGVTNARAIMHIPLIVPDGCRFRVGDETREWAIGTPLIFDDMTMHEAWNDGSGLRAVLIVDLWRPELDSEERRGVAELLALELPD